MKIVTIGKGYLGLVSGGCVSDVGHDVVCVDKLPEKIAMLERGEVPIYEPSLEDVLVRNMATRWLSFITDLASAVAATDAAFDAVGTSTRQCDSHADKTYVMAAAEGSGRCLTGYAVVMTKSTIPLGTNCNVAEVIRRTHPESDLDVAMNPKFLRVRAAIDVFMEPDRVAVGPEFDRAKDFMDEIYRALYLRDFPIVYINPESVEITKYAANAFLATKIDLANVFAAGIVGYDGGGRSRGHTV